MSLQKHRARDYVSPVCWHSLPVCWHSPPVCWHSLPVCWHSLGTAVQYADTAFQYASTAFHYVGIGLCFEIPFADQAVGFRVPKFEFPFGPKAWDPSLNGRAQGLPKPTPPHPTPLLNEPINPRAPGPKGPGAQGPFLYNGTWSLDFCVVLFV